MAHHWSILRHAGGAFAHCDALDIPGIGHAFGTRLLDAGHAAELAGCGVSPGPMLRQVHGAHVVRASDVGPAGADADAVWERSRRAADTCLAVRTADCVPILLATTGGEAIAAVHAGWRGTAQRIGIHAIDRLKKAGYPARSLVVALGPSIGPCCYPVSGEVAAEVAEASGDVSGVIAGRGSAGVFLDLREANRQQLIGVGVPEESVHTAPWCTACEADLFFSYRREGHAAGRQLNLIGPTATRP